MNVLKRMTGVCLLAGCSMLVFHHAGAVGLPPIPLDGLKNLEYGGIEPQPIKLIDGAYESAARVTVRLADELVGSGDLDGDGKADAAVLLTKSSGGNGELTYLAIVVQAGRPVEEYRDPADLAIVFRSAARSSEPWVA